MWDVDSTGMQEIEDQSIAAKIKKKVNTMNVGTFVVGTAISIAYVVLTGK